jgi:hypothetical protein
MSDDLKPVLARQMEVYAGFLEHTDHHIGRLIDASRRPRDTRRHARLLHRRRQRRLGRGHAERLLQRARHPERGLRARDGRHGLSDRRLRHAARPTPVSDDYSPRDSEFTGRVRWVQLDIDESAESVDHLISPEERLQVAMARQ